MVFGLVMAFVAAALAFSLTPSPSSNLFLLLAAVFGSGVALVLDEFALIFHLQDVYWEEEGRKSVDAVVLGIMFGAIFLLHMTPFGADSNASAELITLAILINLPIVIVAALKGKVFMAIFGVFIPMVSLAGAIRLAEPDSVWAKKFYSSSSKKMIRAKERYNIYQNYFRPVKEKAWDMIGGKTGRPVRTKRVAK